MIHFTKLDMDIPRIMLSRGLNANGKVQQFIDNEVMKRMEPYTPFRDGHLVAAPLRNTRVGSGRVVQQTPYARKHYYVKANFSGAPQRGTKWFERMKLSHKRDILKGAAKVARSKSQ